MEVIIINLWQKDVLHNEGELVSLNENTDPPASVTKELHGRLLD